MATYSLSEAHEQFSRLVERAIRGEQVIITKYGIPVVELRALKLPSDDDPGDKKPTESGKDSLTSGRQIG